MYKTKTLIKIFGSLLAFGSLVSVSFGAKLFFSPSTGTFVYNCPFTVDVMVDMEGKDTTAMDLKILLDPSRFSVMNFDGQGGLFRTYTKPKYVTVKRGKYAGVDMLYVFLSTFTPPSGIEGVGKIGTLTIMPHKGVWEMPLGFYFIPGDKTEDTNVPVLSGNELIDGLSQVQGAYYTFKEGVCDYHGSFEYQVTKGGEFELVKNEYVASGKKGIFDFSNFIKKYGWYIILLIVILGLLILFKKKKNIKK